MHQRERAGNWIIIFVIVKNKLMSVCNASVLLLTMNFVITLSNAFAALILIGCRDTKKICLANEILRIPFQCWSWREVEFFTITAEIHMRSLAYIYCQYADRHMNLKFV